MKLMRLFATALLSMLIVRSSAQAPDTLASVRLFMKVCNDYKRLPVQLDVDIRNTTNFVTGREDTGHHQARFCFQAGGSYVGYGDMEQIADDSIVLLVSSRLRRMIIYRHRQPVTEQLQQYLGWQLQDSSVLRAVALYTFVQLPADKDTACMTMTSRRYVPHTGLPAEVMRIKYSTQGLNPFELIQEQRRLIPVSATVYQGLAAQRGNEDRLLVIGDSSWYIIREQTTVYRYQHITHREEDRLPVRISDRIVADAPGRYRPVAAYAGFTLTRQ